MDISCSRCHHTLNEGDCFCAYCGLPQLTYPADAAPDASEEDRWTGPTRDAGTVDWRQALRACLLFAVPAGLMASTISPFGSLGLILMTIAAAWAVTFYVRQQQPAWITIGAGVRIGLVTGLMAGWLAFAASGATLFVERFAFHQGAPIDQEWKTRVDASQQVTQQWMNGLAQADAAQADAVRKQVLAFMLSPEGHAGIEAFGFTMNSVFLLFFAAGGGALGARWGVRMRRRPEA